jgi:outer membrane lipoprotein-sorting protein
MAWTGRIDGGGAQLGPVRFTLKQARPNRSRFEIEIHGEQNVRVFDGTRGWKQRPSRGIRLDVEPYTEAEVRFAKDAEIIDGALIDYAAHGSRVALGGLEEVQGRKAWRIDVLRASGAQEKVWVDAETFLDLQYERTSFRPSGEPVKVTVSYHDFRAFEGVQLPGVIDLGGSGGTPPGHMVLEGVAINPTFDELTFAEPGKLYPRSASAPEPGRVSSTRRRAFDTPAAPAPGPGAAASGAGGAAASEPAATAPGTARPGAIAPPSADSR